MVDQTERRWRRVVDLVDAGETPSPPGDDKYIVEGYRFWTEMQDAEGDLDQQQKISHRYPHIYEAYMIRRRANQPTEDALRTLIILGCPRKELATRFQTPQGVIEWYIRLFCETGDRPLSNMVKSLIFAPEYHMNAITPNNTRAFNMVIGLHDPQALIETLEITRLDGPDLERHAQTSRSMLQHKAIRATVITPINAFTAIPLLEIYQITEKNSREAERASQTSGKISDIVKLIVTGAHFSIMEQGLIPSDMHNAKVQARLPGRVSAGVDHESGQ